MYAYSHNNPVNLVDPDGRSVTADWREEEIAQSQAIDNATDKEAIEIKEGIKKQGVIELKVFGTAISELVGGKGLGTLYKARKARKLWHQQKLQEANKARDELAKELGKAKNRPATVSAGYNVKTGEVIAKGCRGGKCSEDRVVEALGGEKRYIQHTTAVRPRPKEPPYKRVDVCTRCENRYSRDAFPRDATFKSDRS